MKLLKRCWAEIDLDQLERNYGALREKMDDCCKLMAVVKADAYGHGDRQVVRLLAGLGADWFGVSNIEEAMVVREVAEDLPILILGYTPPQCAAQLAAHNITQTVYSHQYARLLGEAARQAGVTVDVHIKVDTGMSRIGFLPEDEQDVAALMELGRFPHFRVTGMFTHFASADEQGDGPQFTHSQFDRFQRLCDRLEESGMEIGLRHCCNSAGIIRYPQMHLDMVRAGISLYGLLPSGDCAADVTPYPVMSLRSVVTMVKELSAGQTVSYGRTFTTTKDMTIATVAVGYADGYDRGYSGRGRVLIRGKYAPIVGRVCMDQCMVDVTHIDRVALGDVVTLAGQDGGAAITMDELAELSGTINYEKVCLVGKRVNRVYLRRGEQVEVDYYR